MSAFAPWQQRIYEQAAAAVDAGRLGHGLLFCGPEKLGKREVAERLAQRLLCTDRRPDGEPCGHCRSCRLFANRTQADPPELRPDGSLAHPFGRTGHPDVMFVGYEWNEKARPPRLRTELVIEQIRAVSEEMALTPQFGGAKIAIIDPAEAINHAAGNALLKTLEEPVPGRYLWLVSSQPARLSATVRSRCQRIEFRLPPRDEALAWLVSQGHSVKVGEEALEAARGHPGLAHEWLKGGGLTLRRTVGDDLGRLARGDATAIDIAQSWIGDDQVALRISHAADIALMEASRLTDPARTRSLAAWFDKANRVRDLLRTTIRADLAVAELLMGWRAANGPPGKGGRKE